MVVEDERAFLEDLALGRILDDALQAHHAFLAGDGQQLEHHREQFQVMTLFVRRALEQLGDAAADALGHADRIGDDQRTDGGAADDEQFIGLPKRAEMAAVHREAPEHATEHEE
jgi:hypothetical protein